LVLDCPHALNRPLRRPRVNPLWKWKTRPELATRSGLGLIVSIDNQHIAQTAANGK
jgi:hypothetical protein